MVLTILVIQGTWIRIGTFNIGPNVSNFWNDFFEQNYTLDSLWIYDCSSNGFQDVIEFFLSNAELFELLLNQSKVQFVLVSFYDHFDDWYESREVLICCLCWFNSLHFLANWLLVKVVNVCHKLLHHFKKFVIIFLALNLFEYTSSSCIFLQQFLDFQSIIGLRLLGIIWVIFMTIFWDDLLSSERTHLMSNCLDVTWLL